MRIAPNGRPFFIDHNSKTTTWVRLLLLFGSIFIVRSGINSFISSLPIHGSCRRLSLTLKLTSKGSSQPASRRCACGLVGVGDGGSRWKASFGVGARLDAFSSQHFWKALVLTIYHIWGGGWEGKQCSILLGFWCHCFTSHDVNSNRNSNPLKKNFYQCLFAFWLILSIFIWFVLLVFTIHLRWVFYTSMSHFIPLMVS